MATITNHEILSDLAMRAWYYALGRLTERGFGNTTESADDFADFARERFAEDPHLSISVMWIMWEDRS